MIGASSTWYATSARPRISRSSAARTSEEDGKELLGRFQDRIRRRSLELRAVVDPPPRDGNRVHPGGLRREDVEGRIADVSRLCGIRTEALGSEKQRLGVRLVAFGLVAADDDLEEMAKRDGGEG